MVGGRNPALKENKQYQAYCKEITKLARESSRSTIIGFVDERALWGTLTPLRWDILKVMTGAGPLALREIARRVKRDVRGVHTDVHSLLAVGLIERDETGFRFPYDAVHVDFTLKAA